VVNRHVVVQLLRAKVKKILKHDVKYLVIAAAHQWLHLTG